MDSERLANGNVHGYGTDEDSDSTEFDEDLGENVDAQGMPLAEPLDYESMEWVDEVIPNVGEINTRSGSVEDLRRDYPTFRNRSPGPKLKGGDKGNRDKSPLRFLKLFWDDVVVRAFLGVMNALRKRKQAKRAQVDWTTVDFWTFLGLTLYFGVVKYPQRWMPWGEDPMHQDDFVTGLMSRKKLEQMLIHFRHANAAGMTEREKKAKSDKDAFWTVAAFLTRVSDNFLEQRSPYQDVSIDEMRFPFKGRHKYRQYDKEKPNQYHFKLYGLCCPRTKCLLRLIPCRGKDGERDKRVSATEWPVLKLLSLPTFFNIGLVVTTDNWCTALYLMCTLLEWGIHLFGTVRSNRKGLPKDRLFPKEDRGKRRRGRADVSSITVSIKSKDKKIYLISWQDNKPVHLLSSIPTSMSQAYRVFKENGVFTGRAPIPIPSIVKGYNRSMGGADLHDQLAQLYRTMIKTLAWQTRIFTQTLHSSVVNAHALCMRYYNLEKNDDGYTFLSFLTLLIKDMCGVDSKKKQREAAARPPMCCPRLKKEAKDTRRWCIQCKKRKSVVECHSCNVALCFSDRGCAEKSYWQLYHEAKAVKSGV